jgi:hypothetical protein
MSLVYRFSRCDPPVRTAGKPSIHAEKDQMFCVVDRWSSALKQGGFCVAGSGLIIDSG